MSNICTMNIVFYGDDEIDLNKLFIKLHEMIDLKNCSYCNEILRDLGIDPEVDVDFDIRAEMYSPTYLPGLPHPGIRIDADSAWNPCTEFVDFLLKKLLPTDTSIKYVYVAEEPGCEIYVNTDEKGMFFKEKLVIDFDDGSVSDREYYTKDEIEDGLRRIYDLTGIKTDFGSLNSRLTKKTLEDALAAKHPGVGTYLTIGIFEGGE